jgi:hypothetical protein
MPPDIAKEETHIALLGCRCSEVIQRIKILKLMQAFIVRQTTQEKLELAIKLTPNRTVALKTVSKKFY